MHRWCRKKHDGTSWYMQFIFEHDNWIDWHIPNTYMLCEETSFLTIVYELGTISVPNLGQMLSIFFWKPCISGLQNCVLQTKTQNTKMTTYINFKTYIKVTDWPNWHFISQNNVQLNQIGKIIWRIHHYHLNWQKSKMAATKLEYIYILACQQEITDCAMNKIDVHKFSWMEMM